jgi:hypothetical protein
MSPSATRVKTSTKRWLRFSSIGLGLQLLLFAFVFGRSAGATIWVEYMYLPIAGVFARGFGEYWYLGVKIGLVFATILYAFAFGMLIAFVVPRRKKPTAPAGPR